jgi:hypothetical protein
MKVKPKNKNLPPLNSDTPDNDHLQGYPSYPAGEDIYGKYQKERDINPEDPSRLKKLVDNYNIVTNNEKDFDDDVTGSDLDIPGSEFDDDLEYSGGEDEENNYYSLGGDDHTDLDEDNGLI